MVTCEIFCWYCLKINCKKNYNAWCSFRSFHMFSYFSSSSFFFCIHILFMFFDIFLIYTKHTWICYNLSHILKFTAVHWRPTTVQKINRLTKHQPMHTVCTERTMGWLLLAYGIFWLSLFFFTFQCADVRFFFLVL